MRSVTLVAVVVSVLAFAGGASAKQTSVWVSVPAAAPHAHVAWTLTVHVSVRGRPYAAHGYRPTVYLIGASPFPAAVEHGIAIAPGTYRVSLVFPRPGTWRYVIPDPLNGAWTFVAPRVAA
jgi:hypothetical protein